MYQDKDLAERRDVIERTTVLPLLRLTGVERVLDIGCGYGRWAQVLSPYIKQYLGVDFSAELLAHARQLGVTRCHFQQLAAQDISPESLEVPPPFECFLCSGILIYLNDNDVAHLASSLAKMAARSARVYLREPMAEQTRLTLDQHFSDELRREYSAIYRTSTETDELFGRSLAEAGFTQKVKARLYPPELCNRKETMQHIQIWERTE